jgi:hypothetical protein
MATDLHELDAVLLARETHFEYSGAWVGDALLLFGLGAFGAGRILGLDAFLERRAVRRAPPQAAVPAGLSALTAG